MTKTEKVLGAGLLATAVAVGSVALLANARVIIVTDGSLRVHADEEDFKEVNASPGKKHKWPERARRVAVWDCSQPQTPMKPFTSVQVNVERNSSTVLTLQFQNESGDLAASFGSGYRFRWTGAWHQLETDTGEHDFKIGSVVVTHDNRPETITPANDTCISFRNRD